MSNKKNIYYKVTKGNHSVLVDKDKYPLYKALLSNVIEGEYTNETLSDIFLEHFVHKSEKLGLPTYIGSNLELHDRIEKIKQKIPEGKLSLEETLELSKILSEGLSTKGEKLGYSYYEDEIGKGKEKKVITKKQHDDILYDLARDGVGVAWSGGRTPRFIECIDKKRLVEFVQSL